MLKRGLTVAVVLLAATVAAHAQPLAVGRGVNEAHVHLKWSDGFSTEFRVRFGSAESDTMTGLGLMDIIENDANLTTIRQDLGWGEYVDGITYKGHSDSGYGGGELWWHYWENDADSRMDWTASWTGAAGRLVHRGDSDTWIYGSAEVPSEPNDPYPAWYGQYQYDANDFAVQCVDYKPTDIIADPLSDLPYDDPNAALGRPTIDTTGDNRSIPMSMSVPATPVYSPFRSTELVSLGEGGSITLAFNHTVRDDPNNPYGLDFIVFGNAWQASTKSWTNGDPTLVSVTPTASSEPGIVSVSQDGIVWYSLTKDAAFRANDPNFIRLGADANDGPFCDSFAPTLGRVYDPNCPDPNMGTWNAYWAEPTNPTLPLNPSLSYASFSGWTVARVVQTYGYSAGGTAYDINRLSLPVDSVTGLKWFKYVRIDDAPGKGTVEIDAVSDVSCPGDYRHSGVKQ